MIVIRPGYNSQMYNTQSCELLLYTTVISLVNVIRDDWEWKVHEVCKQDVPSVQLYIPNETSKNSYAASVLFCIYRVEVSTSFLF